MYKKIAIIAAMEVEVRLLLENLENVQEYRLAGAPCWTGSVGKHELVLMQCGIGKVSAAAGTQALITRFAPDCVINTGCAGALSPALSIGDLVLSDATAEWDMDLLALGLPRGYISALDAVQVAADPALIDALAAVIPPELRVVRGLVVSGDQFVSTAEQRALIHGSFPEAMCAEMEGAAVGHVCCQNGVPFCVVRAMSDTADGSSSVSFAEFAESAGRQSACLLLTLLQQ